MQNTASHQKLNTLWADMLKIYPDGASNTSTTKYNDIRGLLSSITHVPEADIYITGAKTRTSNLDTRFVQGNQAGRHTKIGAAFIQLQDASVSIDKISDSAVVTSRKFVDGSDVTNYDAILVFVEDAAAGGLSLTRVIQAEGKDYFTDLKTNFRAVALVEVQPNAPHASGITSVTTPTVNIPTVIHPENLNGIVGDFIDLTNSPEIGLK